MQSEQVFYGNAKWNTSGKLRAGIRVHNINVGTTLPLRLPDARQLQTGGPHFVVMNFSGGAALLKDFSNNTVATLTDDYIADVFLIDNSTAAGEWAVIQNQRDVAKAVAGTAVHSVIDGPAADPPTEETTTTEDTCVGSYVRLRRCDNDEVTDVSILQADAPTTPFSYGGVCHYADFNNPSMQPGGTIITTGDVDVIYATCAACLAVYGCAASYPNWPDQQTILISNSPSAGAVMNGSHKVFKIPPGLGGGGYSKSLIVEFGGGALSLLCDGTGWYVLLDFGLGGDTVVWRADGTTFFNQIYHGNYSFDGGVADWTNTIVRVL